MLLENNNNKALLRSLLKASAITAFICLIMIGVLSLINTRTTVLQSPASNAVTGSKPYIYPVNYHQPINQFYTYFIDSSNGLDINEIMQARESGKFKKWHSSNSPFNLGVNAMDIWFYLDMKNESSHEQCFVWQLENTTDTAQLYIRNGPGMRAHKPFILSACADERPLSLCTMCDSVWLRPGTEAALYLHVWPSHHNVYLPMSFLPLEEALSEEGFRSNVYSVYIAVFVFIIFFNLFLYISLRDKIHLWYSFTILAVCLFLITDAFYDVYLLVSDSVKTPQFYCGIFRKM
jgi:hypothetical protein